MKKIIALLLTFLLLMSTCAFAASGAIICLNCTVNGETFLNYEGPATFTAIAAGQSVAGWKVNGELIEGETNMWLVFTADGNTVVEALAKEGSEAAIAPSVSAQSKAPAAKTVKVTTVGCTLQYLDGNGKGSGETYTALDFTDTYMNPVTGKAGTAGVGEFKVTADNPHTSAIAYWVINGARYDFNNTVKFITVTDLTYDMTIECVYKQGAVTTMNNEAGEGDELIVSCESAKMAHVTGSYTTGGGYFTEFDFTGDYVNAASKQTVPGGKIDVKVVGTGKGTVQYWEFNEAKLKFGSEITHFVVHELNEKMLYVPHYNGIAKEPSDPGTYYNIRCTGCTFSGGGYSGATSGKVKAGTQITVNSNYGSTSRWFINGSLLQYSWENYGQTFWSTSIVSSVSRTVNRDYTFVAEYYFEIN